MISDDEYRELINTIGDRLMLERGDVNYYTKVFLRLCGINKHISWLFYARRRKLFSITRKKYSKPYICRKIYKKTYRIASLISLFNYFSEKDLKEKYKDFFSIHNKIRSLTVISAIYPYSHMKKYLYDRGMNKLADKYITWDQNDKNITTRSKSTIGNLKLEIYNVAPDKMNALNKIEAHIRFMTATWYAGRLLKLLSSIVGIVAFLMLSLEMVLRVVCDFDIIKDTNHIMFKILNYINKLCYTNNTLGILGVSIFCFIIATVINKLIIKTYNYQRTKEIVTILKLHYECIGKFEKNN